MTDETTQPPVDEQPPADATKTPTRHHIAGAIAATLVTIALIAGAFASGNLHIGGAAVKSQATAKTAITATFGQKQAATHSQTAPVAPFLGPYKLGMCGPGVRLMEGALRNLPKPVRKLPAANCFGKATKSQVIAFQKRLHYKPTGVYNHPTHDALVKRGGYSKTAKAGLRYLYEQRLKKAHMVLVVHERRTVQIVAAHVAKVGGSTLAYSQGPSRSYFPPWPRIPPDTDCSGMSTYILYQAGVGAAVGYFGPGSPVGWTGTLRRQGQHLYNTSRSNLQPGDLVFYGAAPNWSHVATYIGAGLVVSHGRTGVDVESYTYRPVGEIRRYIF